MSVLHVVRALPAAVGHAGRALGRAAARVREADRDGDARWSASELRDVLEPMLEEAGVAHAAVLSAAARPAVERADEAGVWSRDARTRRDA